MAVAADVLGVDGREAEALDRETDPLADAAASFRGVNVDPFEVFINESVEPRGLTESTHRHFQSLFEEWRGHMARQGRHPACPSVEHVEAYIDWQTRPEPEGGRDNANCTVNEKLRKLNQAYEYWQRDPAFPHPDGFNPIALARDRVPLPVEKSCEHRRIPVPELREMVASVTTLRARALITIQLKLGLRAGEVANLRLEDLGLGDAESAAYYPELGSHDRLIDYQHTLYVPSKAERAGNKSTRPRLLPLDEELRALLDRYLLVRPDDGEPWLFLSQKSHTQLDARGVNKIWKEWFHPEYAGTKDHRPVTSHFGRHRFTTYWRVGQDLNRQLVKYMRGDRTGAYGSHRRMDAYLHAYYEDIEALYRAGMYQLECEPRIT